MALVNISMYGELAEATTSSFVFNCRTVAECFAAIQVNYPLFGQYFRDNNLSMKVNNEWIKNYEQLKEPLPDEARVEIYPAIATGAGGDNDTTNTILVIVAIIVMIYAPQIGASLGGSGTVPAAGNSGWALFIQNSVSQIAMSVAVSGISALLYGPGSEDSSKEIAKNDPSYNFNGAVNTTKEGHPVPIGYGTLLIGSGVVSGEMVNEWL